ncbi:uncharacterized protein Z518_05514 [Rhinocladiella mackenziei CBS 650.93]|uniref:Uncharacterized protein n=1 Tax=Rhinocladiella mackenziei CBS 650.93 TaxID=1442369 RepID=A0A0D2IFQ5_9EURO|nr:uncharacterized protein Z518_05514 [Rhinocladiella mackenziei CBS 650.93]KIX04644.1 hypothetical protein Z518_05514 [Rhinocladiella mackenziei CBS 650.93]
MATILPRRAGFICHTCRRSLAPKTSRSQVRSPHQPASKQQVLPKHRKPNPQPVKPRCAVTSKASAPKKSVPPESTLTDPQDDEIALDTFDPTEGLKKLRERVAQITSQEIAAPPEDILEVLHACYRFANCIVFGISKGPNEVPERAGEDWAEAVLQDLAEDKSKLDPVFVPDKEMSIPFREKAAGMISELVYTLVQHPKVFISNDVLSMYVRIQCLLGKPEYLPEIFDLFATKKIPNQTAQPVTYSDPWPKLPKYAIPFDLAEAALEAAILKKNLPLALAIIDTTVAAPAFRANKVLRRASIPFLFVTGTPAAAYAGADWVARWQTTMDMEMSKYTAIAGALAYIGTLTTIGFVAITTTNDQMQRVVWRPGTPLTSRWTREEERAFLDRLALAWGYKEKYRWGEEHGQDWQTLKDECGLRSMILDKTDLMEGMQ